MRSRCFPISSTFRRRRVCSIAIVVASTRHYTNVLYRLPPEQTLPTHSPSGEEIDTTLCMRQLRDLFLVLKQTQLVEQVHEMRSCPYFDCLFAADLLFQHYDVVLPMPKYGREHRSSEASETLRYMRACGATADFNHILQDVKGGAASAGDFVSTSHGIFMGYGTARTNKACMMAITGAAAPNDAAATQQRALSVEPIEMSTDAPPLADLMAFAGKRTLIVQDTIDGRRAAEVATQSVQKVPWQVLRVEPGCSVLSHLCGVNAVYDVLVDQDFPTSMERVGEAGLNPFPVEWSEPRKLGISMRSVCLVARFARGSIAAERDILAGMQHTLSAQRGEMSRQDEEEEEEEEGQRHVEDADESEVLVVIQKLLAAVAMPGEAFPTTETVSHAAGEEHAEEKEGWKRSESATPEVEIEKPNPTYEENEEGDQEIEEEIQGIEEEKQEIEEEKQGIEDENEEDEKSEWNHEEYEGEEESPKM